MSSGPASSVLQRTFITVGGQFGPRQVHYRRGGQGPVVLLLHQSPQSSREMEPLFETWGNSFTLIAPDSPGYGFSEPLQRAGQAVASATIDDFATATLEFADALGVGRFAIYGFHTGASIGLALAQASPSRVVAVAANGVVVLTEDERATILREYLPALVPRWDGGHLAWLWGRVREQIIFFPWHDRRAATRMSFPMPSAARLQLGVDEFLAAGDQYHVAYAAAFADRAERRLPSLRVPVLITAAARDPLARHLARIGARSAAVQVAPAADAGAALELSFAHLVRHPGDAVTSPGAAGENGNAADTSEYAGPPGRQVRIIRTTAQKASARQTVILLHAPGSSAVALRSLSGQISAYAHVLTPDLPGHGASDALPPADGNALAGTVTQLSRALAMPLAAAGTTLIAIGSSAPVAIALAAQPARNTRIVLLEPPAWSAADTDDWLRHGLPALTPVWSGGHLLEAWHLVRDGRLFSPWFRREPSGMRKGEPDLDDGRIHQDVRDLLRANGAWQALLRDALCCQAAAEARSGTHLIRLRQAPADWGDILVPGRAVQPPAS